MTDRRSRKDKMDRLIEEFHPYATGRKADQAFVDALDESFRFHYRNNELFRKNSDHFGVMGIQKIKELPDFPYLFVDLFKSRRMCSVPSKQVKIRLSSSGTGGRKSFHYLDGVSLNRIMRIVDRIFGAHGLVSEEKCNYICFTYDPRVAREMGTAFSDKLVTGLTGRATVYYTLKFSKRSGQFEFDEQECLEMFKRFEKDGRPLRILGFLAYIWKVLAGRRAFQFHPDSRVITGGGWKLHTGEEVPKKTFKKMIAEKLGICTGNIVDTYGMVEHGIPYIDCIENNFHVPVYSRILVRDPLTLKSLPYGTEGVSQLITPYMHSFPAISLLSTDKIRLEKGCACGNKTPYFALLGRGGRKKHKGCAIKAAELLSRMEG